MNQVGRTIYGGEHFNVWSGNSSKQQSYVIQGKWPMSQNIFRN
jgi:hypothetical protein